MVTLSISELTELYYGVCQQDFNSLETYLLNRNFIEAPAKPILQRLSANPTSAEALMYAEKLKQYEIDAEMNAEKFDELYAAYVQNCGLVSKQITDLIYDISGLNNIPEQYRDKVYSHAYQAGHAYGYQEIYDKLNSLVEIFT